MKMFLGIKAFDSTTNQHDYCAIYTFIIISNLCKSNKLNTNKNAFSFHEDGIKNKVHYFFV
jgi:hypothetical protein